MKQKQTAVEWLEEELAKNLKNIVQNADSDLMESLFEKAKQMEKERINKAHYVGYMDGAAKKVIWDDKYYNETYGGAKWF